jgi:hypothetical protein
MVFFWIFPEETKAEDFSPLRNGDGCSLRRVPPRNDERTAENLLAAMISDRIGEERRRKKKQKKQKVEEEEEEEEEEKEGKKEGRKKEVPSICAISSFDGSDDVVDGAGGVLEDQLLRSEAPPALPWPLPLTFPSRISYQAGGTPSESFVSLLVTAGTMRKIRIL